MNDISYEEFKLLINPVPRPSRSWNCGFNYLETWLRIEGEDVEHGVDLSPDFQRGHVWSADQQLSYIENVLRGIVDESGLTIRFNCPDWRSRPPAGADLPNQVVIVDGLQRLTAIRKFIAGDFAVFGVSWDRLPRRVVLRDLTVVIKMYDFSARKDLLKYYLDLNGGGTPHSEAELNRVRGLLNE